MRVTINVKKGSAYAKYNGQQFSVDPNDFLTAKGKLLIPIKGLNPEYPLNYTDFIQDEVLFGSNLVTPLK